MSPPPVVHLSFPAWNKPPLEKPSAESRTHGWRYVSGPGLKYTPWEGVWGLSKNRSYYYRLFQQEEEMRSRGAGLSCTNTSELRVCVSDSARRRRRRRPTDAEEGSEEDNRAKTLETMSPTTHRHHPNFTWGKNNFF